MQRHTVRMLSPWGAEMLVEQVYDPQRHLMVAAQDVDGNEAITGPAPDG